MCVICVKKENQQLPDERMIRDMWLHNPDGAGFMYPKNGKVVIKKGFMELDSFLKAVSKIPHVESVPVVMHFRIATSGGINTGMCHPFPLSDNVNKLKKTALKCNVGIVHNGIIDIACTDGLSDTASFIKNELFDVTNKKANLFKDNAFLQKVEKRIQSKMCVLTGDGDISLIGDFKEYNGYTLSNTYFVPTLYGSISNSMYNDCITDYVSAIPDYVYGDNAYINRYGDVYIYDDVDLVGWYVDTIDDNLYNPDKSFEMEVIY
jgi:predicted glutamine amidotransferase